MTVPKPMSVEDDIAAQIRISDDVVQPAASSSKAPSGPVGPSFSVPTKLEPFLLLAKSTKGASAAKLIEQATAAPGVFVFGELMDMPNIKELAAHEDYKRYYALLELFASGTYKQYLASKDALPQLTDAHILKLKHLSLVSLACVSRTLPYDLLNQELDVHTTRELEDLIIEVIYAGLVDGRLDQRNSRFSVDSVTSRDVSPQSNQQLAFALGAWSDKIQQTISMLDQKIDQARASEQQSQKSKSDQSEAITALLAELANENKNNFGASFARGSFAPSQRSGASASSSLNFTGNHGGGPARPGRGLSDMDIDENGDSARKISVRSTRKRNRP